MDLRYLALGAILSDLVDLPLGIVLWEKAGSVRLVGHSMVFAATALIVVLVATRRGPVRKRWILLAVGVFLHIALDAMWNAPETLWWPFLGWEMQSSGYVTYVSYVRDVITTPVMWAGEFVGLVYLAFLWRSSGLRERSARVRFLKTGVVSAPIDRT